MTQIRTLGNFRLQTKGKTAQTRHFRPEKSPLAMFSWLIQAANHFTYQITRYLMRQINSKQEIKLFYSDTRTAGLPERGSPDRLAAPRNQRHSRKLRGGRPPLRRCRHRVHPGDPDPRERPGRWLVRVKGVRPATRQPRRGHGDGEERIRVAARIRHSNPIPISIP